MGVCGCVIPNPNCHCHSMPNYLVTMPKSVLDQIGKEHTEEIERLRQQNAELVEEIKKLKEAKEVNKYASYPDDGFGGRPMQYDYNRR